jgi:hypothetical protein
MKKLTLPLITLTLAGLTAQADTNLEALRNHAGQVYLESMSIKQMLKQKAPDLNLIRQKVDATKEGVTQLQSVVSNLEASNSSVLKADPAAWEEIKTRVAILGVMHDNKASLASEEGLTKKRSLLRAHVDGVAIRAEKLKQLLNQVEMKTKAGL